MHTCAVASVARRGELAYRALCTLTLGHPGPVSLALTAPRGPRGRYAVMAYENYYHIPGRLSAARGAPRCTAPPRLARSAYRGIAARRGVPRLESRKRDGNVSRRCGAGEEEKCEGRAGWRKGGKERRRRALSGPSAASAIRCQRNVGLCRR